MSGVRNSQLDTDWTVEIRPQTGWWDLKLSDLWRYRDLTMLFVRRDFVSLYKQTLLGPIWFFIQPILTTITFTIIFGKVAKIPTDGLPQVLFYMSGITAWTYFSDCLTKTSTTFAANAGIFGKVYFPRMIVPISVTLSSIMKFCVQFILLLCFILFYYLMGANVHPNWYILLTPFYLLIMAGLGLGAGIIISSLTVKYQDFKFLVAFGTQLLMYATPVVYPLSVFEGSKYKWLAMANPMSAIIEAFKYSYLGAGSFNLWHLLYSLVFMVILLIIGLLTFHRVEKNFMDTV